MRKIEVNSIRAKSLVKSSGQAIESALSIEINEVSIKTILRELYEGLRQYCESIGYLKGYKFDSHEDITRFLKEVLNEESLSIKFDRYRVLRNKINYYGEDISKETVNEALFDIPSMIKSLSKYVKF